MRHAKIEDLANLEAALNTLAQAVAARKSVHDIGMAFRLILVKAAHNPVLTTLYQSVAGLLQEHRRPSYELRSDPQAELRQRQEIFASIRQRDSALARDTMRRHLDYVLTTTRRAVPEAFLHG